MAYVIIFISIVPSSLFAAVAVSGGMPLVADLSGAKFPSLPENQDEPGFCKKFQGMLRGGGTWMASGGHA